MSKAYYPRSLCQQVKWIQVGIYFNLFITQKNIIHIISIFPSFVSQFHDLSSSFYHLIRSLHSLHASLLTLFDLSDVFIAKTIPGGYSGVLVQTRSLSIMGTILESENSNVGTLGRRIPVEFYAFKKYVNLVDVLIYMIQVGNRIQYLV